MAQAEPDLEVNQPCKSGNQIIYAWAKDAPELVLPANTGFRKFPILREDVKFQPR